MTSEEIQEYSLRLSKNARTAAAKIRTVSTDIRNGVLRDVAESLRTNERKILEENEKDVEAGKQTLSSAKLDRLTLNHDRLELMAKGAEQIASFPDPLGKILESRTLSNGAEISRVTVPLGSVFFIYESRPNVTIDGAALCFKAGNSVILRSGKESLRSAKILARIFQASLSKFGIDPTAVQLVEYPDHAIVGALLKMRDYLDLAIPRGGENLIRAVVEQSSIPVIKHYNGICHIYIDKSADIAMAAKIVDNAKTQRPGTCNSMETLLLDKALSESDVQKILFPLREKRVEFFGDETAKKRIPDAKSIGDDSNYRHEYLAYKMSVRFVDGVEAACEHIEKYSSGHTESIIAKDKAAIDYFVSNVDSSSVMVNASTRLADGGIYGLGAEVGISTDKIHARGPMGVESLCSYKWILVGNGQIRV